MNTSDDLSDYLVLLVSSVISLPSASVHSLAAASTAASPATASGTSTITTATTAAAHKEIQFDERTAAHVFRLIAPYKEVNRISHYLELDSSTIWDQVKRQSRYALTTLTEAEKSEQDVISFERGDYETRVKLVLSELGHFARAIRRSSTGASPIIPAPTIPAIPAPTAKSTTILARVTSTNVPIAAATSILSPSPLLTNELFSDELQRILPALFLRCNNPPADAHTITDDEEELDEYDDMSRSDAANRSIDSAFPLPSSVSPPTGVAPFLPLRDLVSVLLHQGPTFGSRILTLLAATKPLEIAALLDVCFDLLRHHLTQLHQKMCGLATTIPTIVNQPNQLAAAAQQIWQCAHATIRTSPFTTLYSFLISVSRLAPSTIGPFVRMRITQMMGQIKLTPPNINIGNTTSNVPLSSPLNSTNPPPPLPASSPAVAAAAAAVASASSSSSAPSVTPAPGMSTPARPRSAALPAPVNTTPRQPSQAAGPTHPTAPYATPTFITAVMANSFTPIAHFLPALTIGVTLDAIRDDISFLDATFRRLTSSTSGRPDDRHFVVDYLRDSRMSEEYTDLVQPAVTASNQAAAAAATAALHAQASKARGNETESGRKRKGTGEARDRDRVSSNDGRTGKDRSKGVSHAPSSARDLSSTLRVSGSTSAAAASKSNSIPTSPALNAHNNRQTQIAPAIPTLAGASPQKNYLATGQSSSAVGVSSPTLYSAQLRDSLLLTPTRRGLVGPDASMPNRSTSPFYVGSVDALRCRLTAHINKLRATLTIRRQTNDKHNDGQINITDVKSTTQLIKIYSYLLLYCNYSFRPCELSLFQSILPSDDPVDLDSLADAANATAIHALSHLLQHILVFIFITPQPAGGGISSSSSSSSSSHLLRPLFGQSSVTPWNPTLVRLKRWMAAIQRAQRRIAANEPIRAELFALTSDNLLFQAAMCSLVHRPGDLLHLLRSILHLPSHFKPTLLSPYAERMTQHAKEVMQAITNSGAAIWSRAQVLAAVFSPGPADESLIDQIPCSHLYRLRSTSPFIAACFTQSLSNAFHLLRPASSSLASIVSRSFFEYQVGFWLRNIIRVVGPNESHAKDRPKFHPLLSHAAIFGLFDTMIELDLSSAILAQQHMQPIQPQQHRPAQVAAKCDARILKEEEVRELMAALTENTSRQTIKSEQTTDDADTLVSIDELPNPIGLALAVYYVLCYNSFVLRLWSRCLPSNVDSSTPADSVTPSQPPADSVSVPLPTVPPTGPTAREFANGIQAVYTQLGLPAPPFGATHLAQAISNASALQPYPMSVLNRVPLRGLLEYLKRMIRSSNSSASSSIGCWSSNLSTLFMHLHRFLSQLLPETIIGFECIGVTQTVTTTPDANHIRDQEGSIQLIRGDERSTQGVGVPITTGADADRLIDQMRARAHQPDYNADRTVEVTNIWFILYSSPVSSMRFVYASLVALVYPIGASSVDFPLMADLILDPIVILTRIPPRLFRRAPLLRVLNACLFHLLVASTSFFALLSKAESVAAQFTRQGRYHAAHANWLNALRLMANPGNTIDKKQVFIQHDPLTLMVVKEVEKAARDVFAHDKKTNVNEQKQADANANTNVSANSDPDTRPSKRAKREQPLPIQSQPHAPSSSLTPATVDLDNNTNQPCGDTNANITGVSPLSSSIDSASPFSSSSSLVSSSARPFSFLISDRLLSSGEQQLFSSEYALAPIATNATMPQHAQTPNLRAFAYLLSTRLAVIQFMLQRAADMISEVQTDADAHLQAASDSDTIRSSVMALLSFTRVVLLSSVPVDSPSPSSLLLLLHVHGFPSALLPLAMAQLTSMEEALCKEPIIVQRIRDGTSHASTHDAMEHTVFCWLFDRFRSVIDHATPMQPHLDLTHMHHDSGSAISFTAHLSSIFRSWSSCLALGLLTGAESDVTCSSTVSPAALRLTRIRNDMKAIAQEIRNANKQTKRNEQNNDDDDDDEQQRLEQQIQQLITRIEALG